jgi:hypothetical protein
MCFFHVRFVRREIRVLPGIVDDLNISKAIRRYSRIIFERALVASGGSSLALD